MFATTSNYQSNVKSYTTSTTYTTFKKSDTASFKFAGQTSSNTTTTIDVNNVSELKSLVKASVLPSSFESLNNSHSSTNSDFLQFINTLTSKGYPISKITFKVTADDTNGILKIKASIPRSYSPNDKDESFDITYTGLNKISSYSFEFKKNLTIIDNTNINQLLPLQSVMETLLMKWFNIQDLTLMILQFLNL